MGTDLGFRVLIQHHGIVDPVPSSDRCSVWFQGTMAGILLNFLGWSKILSDVAPLHLLVSIQTTMSQAATSGAGYQRQEMAKRLCAGRLLELWQHSSRAPSSVCR
jgi:hypothetical protein